MEDHSIWFPAASFRIPLSLRGIFSYFLTRKPTRDELQSCDDVLVMTPQSHSWNPHSDVYARNEENMLDWEGNMLESHHQPRILVEELPEIDNSMLISSAISSAETELIDKRFKSVGGLVGGDEYVSVSKNAELSGVSSIYDPNQLCNLMSERRNDSVFAASIGSTTVGTGSEFLVETVDSDDGSDDEMLDSDDEMSDGDEDPSCDDLFGDDIDLDDLLEQAFVRSTTAAKP